jgi:hypothetical protein
MAGRDRRAPSTLAAVPGEAVEPFPTVRERTATSAFEPRVTPARPRQVVGARGVVGEPGRELHEVPRVVNAADRTGHSPRVGERADKMSKNEPPLDREVIPGNGSDVSP